MELNRTFLFVPGNHPRKVEKVFEAGADAVILDLEDAVAIAEKAATRAPVRAALSHPRTCKAYVRVNAIDTGLTFEDLEAVVAPGLDGVVLPMVERAADVQMVDWVMTSLERKQGLPLGHIDLMPIVETARGLVNVREIAAAGIDRMKRLSFGAGDYTQDLGIEWSKAETELLPARSEIVVASRAARLEPPIDTVYIHIRDDIGFRTSTAAVRDLGFQGKLCIHPGQIRIAHSVFTPTEETIAWARKLIAAFDEAESHGSASIQVDGYFVDYPIFLKAKRVVALAEAAKSATSR